MSKTGTVIEKNLIIFEMLPYGIDMLRHAYGRLQSASHGQATANILIECFCLHARNLLDFFWDKKHSNHAVAREFTTPSYNPFGGVSPKTNGVYRKLHDQILHLTYGRTDVMEEKIGHQQRAELKNLIEKEIDNFGIHIDASYRHLWNRRGEFLPDTSMSPNTTTSVSTSVTLVWAGPSAGPADQRNTIAVGATGSIEPTDKPEP